MPNSINIAICDDEEVQVDLLKKYVNSWAKRTNRKVNIDKFYSGDAFQFSWSMDRRCEILLLDIEMSGINGVDLARQIREEDEIIKIIFITAIPDHIQEGYDVDAINYLIKPIEESKLGQCLDRAVEKIPKEEKTILVNQDGEIIRIIQDEILYIEAFSHSVEINLGDGRYIIRESIGKIEEELDKGMFIRCHRSYIVGIKHIKKISRTDIELDNKDIIPVSRRRYSKTNMAFIDYFRGGRNG